MVNEEKLDLQFQKQKRFSLHVQTLDDGNLTFLMRSVASSAQDGLSMSQIKVSDVRFCNCGDAFNAKLLYLIAILFLFSSNVLHQGNISMDAATFYNSRCRSESLSEPQNTRH